jgi:hypothetical protein
MPAPAPRPPKPRKVAAWIMTRPDTLTTQDQASLDAILAASPELSTLTEHVCAFATLMTERRGRDLEQWMTAAATSGEPALQSFVTGLRAEQDAVTAGLTLRWSCDSVEGHINRIKMLKRQMYGRATTTCSAAASSSPTDLTKLCQSHSSGVADSLHRDPIHTSRRHAGHQYAWPRPDAEAEPKSR